MSNESLTGTVYDFFICVCVGAREVYRTDLMLEIDHFLTRTVH